MFDQDKWAEEISNKFDYKVEKKSRLSHYFGPAIVVSIPNADTDWPSAVRIVPFTDHKDGYKGDGRKMVEVKPYWGSVTDSTEKQIDLWTDIYKFVRCKVGKEIGIVQDADKYF